MRQSTFLPLEQTCSLCRALLPITEFTFRRTRNHYMANCKECERRRDRSRNEQTKRTRAAKRRAEGRTICRPKGTPAERTQRQLEVGRSYRERHRAERNAAVRRYYALHAEERREATRARRRAHPEQAAARHRQWVARNGERWRALHHHYRARARGADGAFTLEDVERMKEMQAGLCAYCGLPYGRYQIEHKQPLSRGGTNWPGNLCLSCASCNRRKNAKTEADFRAILLREAHP